MSSMLEAVEKEDEAERPRPYARSRPRPDGWDEGNVTVTLFCQIFFLRKCVFIDACLLLRSWSERPSRPGLWTETGTPW